MTDLDEKELFTYLDPEQFIDRSVERFTQRVDTDSVSIYNFDRMILAAGGGSSPYSCLTMVRNVDVGRISAYYSRERHCHSYSFRL